MTPVFQPSKQRQAEPSGQIVFVSDADGNQEIYGMNAERLGD